MREKYVQVPKSISPSYGAVNKILRYSKIIKWNKTKIKIFPARYQKRGSGCKEINHKPYVFSIFIIFFMNLQNGNPSMLSQTPGA